MTAHGGQPVRPTPPYAPRLRVLALPSFWLMVCLVGYGAYRIGGIVRRGLDLYPTATAAALVLFAVYAVPFVLFVRARDFLEPEPIPLLVAAFAWGGLAATAQALPANAAIRGLAAKLVSPAFAEQWSAALAGPTVEEPLKALGVVVIALLARWQINSVVDGFVYGAFVGLGFQIVEDVVYSINNVHLAGRGDVLGPVVSTFLLRGFVGGLWSHTMFSALAGAGIGYALVRVARPVARRVGVAALALAGAWLCHFVWNSPLLMDGFGAGGWGVVAALVLKGAPALAVILWLARVARRQEAEYYVRWLTSLDDPVAVTPGELRALARPGGRRAARAYARERSGTAAARIVDRLQRVQARLAVELSRDGYYPPWRDEAHVLRTELVRLRHPDAAAPADSAAAIWRWAGWLALAALVVFGLTYAINALGAY